jgi:hypothetical protein
MSAERLEPKGTQSSPECLTSRRRELTGLPVYRADLNPPVMNAEHGNAASLDHGRGQPDRKAGPAGAALGWPKKPRPVCNEPDKPTSAWPGKARKVCGTTSTWELQWMSDARCSVHPELLSVQRNTANEGRNSVSPNGARGIGCAV